MSVEAREISIRTLMLVLRRSYLLFGTTILQERLSFI